MDEVFRALADPSRRQLLDNLNARNGQTLRELCRGLEMARQSVSKHLSVLEAANLVTTAWRGREKLHYLNAEPINAISDRWMNQYDRERARAITDLKTALEQESMADPVFVYTTYINTSPERLWQALTDPAFTRRYWSGVALHSDWRVGSPIKWQNGPNEDFEDLDQVVLEADPYRRLAYTWHRLQPQHADRFGLTEAEFAVHAKEKNSKVAFDIERGGAGVRAVRLTVTHSDFDSTDSVMYRGVSGRLDNSGGWPELVANLKTLLETGATLPAAT